jgi:hypothetical protein
VSNFLVLVPTSPAHDRAEALFRAGLELTQEVKGQKASGMVTEDWSLAALFPRQNGSGGPLVTDQATGSWLMAVGTWFHTDGHASGDERRLLERYFQVGPERLGRELEGFFVVILGDGRTRETIVITDLVASCRCYVRTWKDAVALAGSSFVLAGMEQAALDPVGWQEFLGTGIIYDDRSLYREVRKLRPAGVYRLSDGASPKTTRYWRTNEVEPCSLQGTAAVHALGEAMQRAGRKVARTFSRVACDLTGGYDSRALAGMLRTAGLSLSTVVVGAPDSPDVVVSRKVAEVAQFPHLHLEHLEPLTLRRVVDGFAFTDGEFDLVDYAPILEVHRRLSESFDISLNGSFGELTRGYWWELLPQVGARRPVDAHKVAKRRYAALPYDSSVVPAADRIDLVTHFTDLITRTNEGLEQFPNTFQMNNCYLAMRMSCWQGRIASSTNQLWPCLSPGIFRSVIEAILRTDPRLCRRSLLPRRLLAEYQPAMAAVPLEHGHPALPFTWRTAPRFWPFARTLAAKAAHKVAAKFGRRDQNSAASVSRRLQLWKQDEVRELLHPPTMRLSRYADPANLAEFLRRSQESGFPYDGQWGRVLTMEIALRKLERVAHRPTAATACLSGGC